MPISTSLLSLLNFHISGPPSSPFQMAHKSKVECIFEYRLLDREPNIVLRKIANLWFLEAPSRSTFWPCIFDWKQFAYPFGVVYSRFFHDDQYSANPIHKKCIMYRLQNRHPKPLLNAPVAPVLLLRVSMMALVANLVYEMCLENAMSTDVIKMHKASSSEQITFSIE